MTIHKGHSDERVLRRRRRVWTYLVLVGGFSLWMTYGIHKGDVPLIATNCFTLSCGAMILYFKLKHG